MLWADFFAAASCPWQVLGLLGDMGQLEDRGPSPIPGITLLPAPGPEEGKPLPETAPGFCRACPSLGPKNC